MKKALTLILTAPAAIAAVSIATASDGSRPTLAIPTSQARAKPANLELTRTRSVERAGDRVRITYFKSRDVNVGPGESKQFRASCRHGAKAIDGGFVAEGTSVVPNQLEPSGRSAYSYGVVNLDPSLIIPTAFSLTCLN